MNQQVEEITLLLLWLTSWKEEAGEIEIRRSWKEYDFDVLNDLSKNELIVGSYKSKSVYFTDKGIEEAKKIAGKSLNKN
ncbi:MAG: DUF6429 family protein [Minisyncoccia bacterium]